MSGPVIFEIGDGLVKKANAGSSTLHTWKYGSLSLCGEATHFGFVHEGAASLRSPQGTFSLREGMYFSLNGAGEIEHGSGLVVSHRNHRGFFSLGGPVEERGRLRYIDGCSDSLLIAPVRRGDPCLNLLHLPAATRQSPHVHPSLRAGLVISGRGCCVTESAAVALEPGRGFVLPPGLRHAFRTDAEPLAVIVYHPDSDFGPTDNDHPMINQTLLRRGEESATALEHRPDPSVRRHLASRP